MAKYAPQMTSHSPIILMIAKVASWIVIGICLAGIFMSLGSLYATAGALLYALPPALSLRVYYGSPSAWITWTALIGSVLWVLLGSFVVFVTLLGLAGYPYFDVANPTLVIGASLVLFIIPGIANFLALRVLRLIGRPPTRARRYI
jgi:hypothetical protein